MKSFSIDTDNNITAFAGSQESKAAGGESFRTEAEWSKLTAEWPTRRLVEVWNGIPGFTPVNRFTNRKTAVARIWKSIQGLGRHADQTPRQDLTPKKKRKVTKSRNVDAASRKVGKVQANAQTREGTKSARILNLRQKPEGATLKQLARITGWQAHSVRGFLSGQLGKKKGLSVRSFKRDGERVYALKS